MSKELTENQIIAGEIMRQMGGARLLTLMIGAKYFVAVERGLTFKFGACNKYNYVKITLVNDLYKVELMKIRGTDIKTHDTESGLYDDMLVSHFESETGLTLRMPRFVRA